MRNSTQIFVAVAIVGGILSLASIGMTPQPSIQPTSVHRPASSPALVGSHEREMLSPPGERPLESVSGSVPASKRATAEPPVDLAAGRQVYRKCQACHSLEAGKVGVGPNLAGVIGRAAGSLPGYNYSTAIRESGLTWDPETLDAYLQHPQETVPGNKMPFPGLKTENERREVIALLRAVSAEPGSPLPVANAPPDHPPSSVETSPAPRPTVKYIPDVRFTLRAGAVEGKPAYIGVGGGIEGQANPTIRATEGQVVQLTLINGDQGENDIVFPDQLTRSPRVVGEGASTTIAFRAPSSGDFTYLSSVPGRDAAGMKGAFVVSPRPPPDAIVEADISREPTDLPGPIATRGPETVRLDLVTVEQEGRLADGTTYMFWTFNGRVPGPFVRVRVGDTIEVHVKNAADSAMIHSVDFHAATGPGGGAAALQVDPGQEKSMKWKALVPGLYVYHCATPMVAHHIASGMYGLIMVEPEGGLPPVDREFYVMQGEIYTDAPFGERGSQEFSVEHLLNERPEYFVFNGSVGAISSLHPIHAKVGETVRIFFGVGGPNFTSSFHMIGEIFDTVYNLASLISEPLHGVQTVLVPAGGAVIVEFKLDVPGNYILVDHALARAERGLVGILTADGAPNPKIYDGVVMPGGH